jgi:hypothetical protein
MASSGGGSPAHVRQHNSAAADAVLHHAAAATATWQCSAASLSSSPEPPQRASSPLCSPTHRRGSGSSLRQQQQRSSSPAPSTPRRGAHLQLQWQAHQQQHAQQQQQQQQGRTPRSPTHSSMQQLADEVGEGPVCVATMCFEQAVASCSRAVTHACTRAQEDATLFEAGVRHAGWLWKRFGHTQKATWRRLWVSARAWPTSALALGCC